MEEERNNENPLQLEMEDVNGNKVNVQIIKMFEDEGKTYVLADNIDGDDESYIFQLIQHEDGDELVSIDSEEEFNRLCDVVESILDEEEEEE